MARSVWVQQGHAGTVSSGDGMSGQRCHALQHLFQVNTGRDETREIAEVQAQVSPVVTPEVVSRHSFSVIGAIWLEAGHLSPCARSGANSVRSVSANQPNEVTRKRAVAGAR